MNLYIMRMGSGHDWLVEADSEEAALADWPSDAEEVALCEEVVDLDLLEALGCQAVDESDVDDETLRDAVLEAAVWTYSHCPTSSDDEAVGVSLVLRGQELAAGLWSGGVLDLTSDGCGVFAPFDAVASAEDLDWPSEDEARAQVWGDS